MLPHSSLQLRVFVMQQLVALEQLGFGNARMIQLGLQCAEASFQVANLRLLLIGGLRQLGDLQLYKQPTSASG